VGMCQTEVGASRPSTCGAEERIADAAVMV